LKTNEQIEQPFRSLDAIPFSDLGINRHEIYLNLGYGDQTPDDHILQMIEQIIAHAGSICSPRAGFGIFTGKFVGKDFLEINQASIKIGRVIAKYFNAATHFAPFVASVGIEFDQYLHHFRAEGDLVNEFLADAVGSEIAEATVRYVTDRISEQASELGFSVTHPYSPGYCSWHVREQQALFSLLPNEPCGIKLNNSSLMFPVKSVSGMIGLGTEIKETPYACEICGLQTCYKRKLTH
jgi:hypothetical protein